MIPYYIYGIKTVFIIMVLIPRLLSILLFCDSKLFIKLFMKTILKKIRLSLEVCVLTEDVNYSSLFLSSSITEAAPVVLTFVAAA